MSRIEEMTKRLCPEGVERVKIGNIYKRLKGTPITAGIMKEIENSKGNVTIFAGGKTIITAYEKDIPNSNVQHIPAVIVQSRGIIDVQYCDSPFTFKNEMWAYTHCNVSSVKYLYYFLRQNIEVLRRKGGEHGSMPQISLSATENYKIPLPPLSIQQEIVSALDSFTTLIDKMKKEVELRKKQMEYYREKLMSPRDNWEIKTLGEIGTFTKGTGLLKSDFREMGFPCIHYGQIHTYYNTVTVQTISFCEESYANKLRKASYGDLLIATTSEDVEACCKAVTWLGKGEVAYSGDSHCFSHNQDPKFVAYLFQTEMFTKQKRMAATGAKVVRVSGESMATFSFAFPPLSTQHSIVRTLDAFDSYITKLEKLIALREKQYEYYREKLLTFE